MNKYVIVAFLSLSIVNVLHSARKDAAVSIDFSSIKDLLRNDNLEQIAKEKEKRAATRKVASAKKEVGKFDLPKEGDFWGFVSELWLVRNAEVLKWDFKVIDYGIETFFENFLASMGRAGVGFKILFINSANVAHFALPGSNSEPLFVLSLPFVRSLDLSKLQIALLLYEDLFRFEAGYFRNFVADDKVKKFIGGNFHKKPYPEGTINGVLAKYDEFILEKGFNFKQQFQITKMVDNALGAKPDYKNAYRSMIEKKDKLVKSNLSFRRYPQIYPSPELQMNWLVSKRDDR